MAATSKNEIIEKMVDTIKELTETNAILTEQLKKALAAHRNAREGEGGGSGGGDGGGGNCCNKTGNINNINNNNNNDTPLKFPNWCDPDAYYRTCGYKLKKVHCSSNCRLIGNLGHKKEAMR